jgi:hypothetical protein
MAGQVWFLGKKQLQHRMLRRSEMKRFILVVISCIFVMALTGRYSFAQTDSGMKGEQKGEMKQQGMKMDEGMMKQMMEKCQPMMKQMMGDGMMKKEMMQMMMEMMNMQEKMMKGPKAAEKKQMMKDTAQMKENLNVAKQTKTDVTGTLEKPCSGTF